MKITILGAGAYSIALALMFNENKCDITLWEKFEKQAEELKTTRINKKALKDTIIPKNIKITSNLKESIENSNIIVFAIPTIFVNEVSIELAKYIKKEQHICIATKGIEQESCLFVDSIIKKHIKTNNIAVISGPSLAEDVSKYVPTALTLATKNKKTSLLIHQSLENQWLKLRDTKDIIGTEICGSIKNVIAIAAGIINGLGLPDSTQSLLITEALNDIKILIKHLGGDEKTVLSYAGVGDLVLTCTCKKSRNFKFGCLIGQKKKKEELNDYKNNNTVEGLYTLVSIHKLIEDRKIDMPIITLIYNIIFLKEKPETIKNFLITKK